MLCTIFLAETITWDKLAPLIVAIVGGPAVVVVILLVALRGFWESRIVPLIRKEIELWYAHEGQQEARRRDLLRQLYHPELTDFFKKHTETLVETHVKRTDGVISLAITKATQALSQDVSARNDEIMKFLNSDVEFKQKMLQNMAKIEGAMHGLFRKSWESTDSMPAINPKSR